MWTAAIIAGGRARRMGGREKADLLVGTRSILDRQVAVVRTLVDHLLIVTSDPTRFRDSGLPVIIDRIADVGPLGGLYTAIVEAPTEHTLAIACDLPFLTKPFLHHLLVTGLEADIVVPRGVDGYHPLCATYTKACAGPLRRQIDQGARRLTDLLDETHGLKVRVLGPGEIAPFDPEGALLFNVNTPDDYSRAAALAGRLEREPAPSADFES